MVHFLAVENARNGIRVNAVAPFILGSETTEEGRAAHPDEKRMLEEKSLLGRLLKRQEVVETMVFLTSAAASAITGQILEIGGPRGY